MKAINFFILGLAAASGYVVYQARTAITGSDNPAQAGLLSYVTGQGSLGQTFHDANNARVASQTTATAKPTDKPIDDSSKTPAVEDLAKSDTALIEAAAKGDIKKVEERLSQQVRIDSRDSMRRTPLMYASANNHADICIRLLAAGANPELEDRSENNAFDYAAGRGLTDMVNLLLKYSHHDDNGQYVLYSQLIQAVLASDVSRIPAGTGKIPGVNRPNIDDQSPLHIAAGNGSVPMIEALIARGANVNVTNETRQTPMLWAAWNNQPDAIEALIKDGGDMSIADLAGNTPLIFAVQNKSVAAAKILIKHGADKYVSNKLGKNAEIIAEDNGLKELADLLK